MAERKTYTFIWNLGPSTLKLRHVVESQQFTLPLLMELFDRSRGMERIVARGGSLDHQNRILASLFYQPSTRTRFSFEAAMYRLGGRVLSTEQARAFSSEVEGEQVEDTIRIIGGYADVIVIRHHEQDGARAGRRGFARSGDQCRRRQWRPAPDAGAARSVHHLPRASAGWAERGVHRRTRPRANGPFACVLAGQVRAHANFFCQPARNADEA